MRRLSIHAPDRKLFAVVRTRRPVSQVTLPAGRSLLVVARAHGQGPYTLALSGDSGSSGS
jgi:hypothetical protein